MLNIYLGDMENAIYHPPVYFDNTYEDEWITDELSVKMIKDIDKSDVIGPHLVQSPQFSISTLRSYHHTLKR